MVDPTKGVGNIQNLLQSNRSQPGKEAGQKQEASNNASSSSPADEVTISQEALSLGEAERTASDVRAQLSNSDQTLSTDSERLADLLA